MSATNPISDDPISNDPISETENVKARSSDLIIIDKILNYEELKRKVDLWNEEGVLNLIQPEWKKVLYNDPVFQKHKNKQVEFFTKQEPPKHYIKHTIINKDDHFQLLVAGYFRVNSGCVVTYSCPPLAEIGQVMCTKTCLNNCKFFVQSCGGVCPNCRVKKEEDKNKKEEDNWCKTNSQQLVPNGIQMIKQATAEKKYKSPTVAIVRIDINMNYDFGSFSKIGGIIKSICFVQDCFLRPEDNLLEEAPDDDDDDEPAPKKLREDDTIYAVPEGVKMDEPSYEVNTFKLK